MILHGTGCCLIDYLYASVDFSSSAFLSARSLREGDGGLIPGKLVFAEDFEHFIKKPYPQVLQEITGGAAPTRHNLGGPSVVSLAHAAQILNGKGHEVAFYGVRGTDSTGQLILQFLQKLPFSYTSLMERSGLTPRTDVLSDPNYNRGQGERTFINLLGVSQELQPEDLSEDFFQADIVAFGGTALVPHLHENLTWLLKKARSYGALTVVNLVYDFPSERDNPGQKWKLGGDDNAYEWIDLLIADKEEALKTSAQSSIPEAITYFLKRGTGAVVVTEGAQDIHFQSQSASFCPFKPLSYTSWPICEAVKQELSLHPERKGDTTGCGDNFAGGLLANLIEQIEKLDLAPSTTVPNKVNCRQHMQGLLDLKEACVWAVAAGGFTCFIVGGTYYEHAPGEKRRLLEPLVTAYREQLSKIEAL